MAKESGGWNGADVQLGYASTIEEAARRQQGQALAALLHASGVMLWRAGSALATLVARIAAPITWRLNRRAAIADLRGLDPRMLADIGLQRGDIELAVDGHLVDERVRHPRSAAATAVTQLRPQLAPETAANRNQTAPAALAHAS
jgi:uncharacterized protein YjiS (DUF1127 family)